MSAILFTNVSIFDGTGSQPFPGEVKVENNRITAVAKGAGQQIARDGARVIDVLRRYLSKHLADTTQRRDRPTFARRIRHRSVEVQDAVHLDARTTRPSSSIRIQESR